jgi:uncharacterized membrane protein
MRVVWRLGAPVTLCVLIAALAGHVLLGGTAAARIVLAAGICAPLLLALRGVARRRREVLKRFAVLLVAYIGLISVEVVASSGHAALLNVALLAAALELGLVIALLRRGSHAPTTRE